MENAPQSFWDLTFGGMVIQYLALMAREFGGLYMMGFVAYFVERVRPAHPEQHFFKSDFKTELGYPVFNTLLGTPVFTLLVAGVTLYLLKPLAPHFVLAGAVEVLPFVVQVFIALLLADIAIYVEHRFIAHYRLWDYHSLHHMTPEVSWLTTARVHPVNAITIAMSSAVSFYVLGFSGTSVSVAAFLGGALAAWEHSNMDFAWPKPLCYLLVSPRFHRWHHAKEAEAVDKNFCLIFPFLDLLGGTYYCPDRMPHAYGLYVSPDAPDHAVEIPATIGGQMLYPFKRSLEKLRLMSPPSSPAVEALREVDQREGVTPTT